MITPLYNHIAIRRIDEMKSPGGLVLPEASRNGPGLARGTVVAVRLAEHPAAARVAQREGALSRTLAIVAEDGRGGGHFWDSS